MDILEDNKHMSFLQMKKWKQIKRYMFSTYCKLKAFKKHHNFGKGQGHTVVITDVSASAWPKQYA